MEPEFEFKEIFVTKKCNKSQKEEQDNKLFKCSICYKNYGTKYSLKEHVGVVHEGKKYKCDECNEIFSWKSGLNSHIRETRHSQHTEVKITWNWPVRVWFFAKCSIHIPVGFLESSNLSNVLKINRKGLVNQKLRKSTLLDQP